MIRAVFNTFGANIDRGRGVGDAKSPEGVTWTAAERNVRVPVILSPQESPDPIRDGATPARQAKVQVVTFAYDMGMMMGSEDFAWGENVDIGGDLASTPFGNHLVWRERSNIAPPQHVAYGSLFQTTPTLYGMG
jgi:hypothetical protein